jgi:hypothetical protein
MCVSLGEFVNLSRDCNRAFQYCLGDNERLGTVPEFKMDAFVARPCASAHVTAILYALQVIFGNISCLIIQTIVRLVYIGDVRRVSMH